MKNTHVRRVTLIMLIAIILLQLLWVAGKVGTVSAVPPLPIGDTGYHQPSPFESNPTNATYSGIGVPSGAVTNAYDGQLSTNTNFQYGFSASDTLS